MRETDFKTLNLSRAWVLQLDEVSEDLAVCGRLERLYLHATPQLTALNNSMRFMRALRELWLQVRAQEAADTHAWRK